MRILICLVAVALTAARAEAKIIKGPHLQNIKSNGVTIIWQQDDDSLAFLKVNGINYAVPPGLIKEIRVSGLQPDTTYRYEIIVNGETASHEFTTAPLDPLRPFVFLVTGDMRTLHDDHQAVVQQMLEETDADLVINTGDLVESGESEDDWQKFFDIEAPLISEIPWYSTVGNHEVVSGQLPNLYFDYLATPIESSGSEAYYSFTYANSAFIFLDIHANIEEHEEDDWTDFSAPQRDWLNSTLQNFDADASIQHIFVFVHVPPFSSKPGRTGSHAVRSNLPLFAEHGVDAVFSGHDHYLERGVSFDGVRYFIVGGGGAPLYTNESVDNLGPKSAAALPWLDDAHIVRFAAKLNGYMRLEVSGESITATYKDSAGQILDSSSWRGGEVPDTTWDAGTDSTDGGGDQGDELVSFSSGSCSCRLVGH